MCNILHPLYLQNSFTALKSFVLHLFMSSLTTTLWQSRFFFLTISMCASMLICFSYVQYSVMLWTMACQAPLSMGFSRVRKILGGMQGNPLQYSCLENPVDREDLWVTVYGVAKSRTWLKQHYMHNIHRVDNRFIYTFTYWRHLYCFQVLSVMNNDIINIHVKGYCFGISFQLFWVKYEGAWLLFYLVREYLVF